MVHHLSPRGVAGFVLANGSMSSTQSNEDEIRKNLVEDDLIDCMVALPGQLFRSTQIPACLWFLRRNRGNRSGATLFIDARDMGHMLDRTRRELSTEEIAKIAAAYHAWQKGGDAYQDAPGFCKSVALDDIRAQAYVLTPGRYVGVKPPAEDVEPFPANIAHIATQWRAQQTQSAALDAAIAHNLDLLGFTDGNSHAQAN